MDGPHMICTAPPLVILKHTVQSYWADVVDNKVRVLLYVSGIPTAGRKDRRSKWSAAPGCNIKQVVENMRNRGFSLIELLIAIVVVGVLAAIALPAYTSQ